MARLIGRGIAGVTLAVALCAAAPGSARAQSTTVRFYVDSVADSTFSFRVARDDNWVRTGATGIAVDPARRDALIARYRVISVWGDRATALVTGQATVLTVRHVALLERPPRRFYRARAFWGGALIGVLLGAGGGLLLGGA